jgi:hypothetical protein
MLTFEEVYETIPGNGWLTKEEARLLWTVVNNCSGSILEVGSYHGRSTVLLAVTGRNVHAVDPFSGFDSDDPTGDLTYQKFMNNVFHSRCLMNVHLHRRKVEDWYPLESDFGFAYLDGDHTYEGTLRQIQKAKDIGAWDFCIHDYAQSRDGLHIAKAIKDSGLTLVSLVERMVHCHA